MIFIDLTMTEKKESESIHIHDDWVYGCDKCIVCNGYFKHTRIWWGENQEDGEKGIFLLREKIAHGTCRKLLSDIKKKKEELCELENKLLEKQLNQNEN